MPSFLAESYIPRARAEHIRDADQRARAAARELAKNGTPIRYVRSILVPEDEICFFVFEAVSAEAVESACARAGVRFERVVAAVESSPGQRKKGDLSEV